MQDQKNTNRKNSLLTEGDIIILSDREFKIRELISDKGASAVCYKAERDGSGVGTLKEFLPVKLNFHRNTDNQVIFDDNSQDIQKMIDEYIKPHEILMDKRTDENIAVFIPVFEILYGCSDDGKQASVYLWTPEPPKQTFEEFCKEVHADTQRKPEENLFHILTAVLSLSKCLIYMHKAKLVHRDIKPSNFGFPILGNDKLSNNITIFDINTVCSVFTDEYDGVFSDGFTEPENKRPTNQTDIYSVGATLYYAVIGKKYDNNFNEIETDINNSELMKVLTNTIHPKLKGKIISVLKKTLASREKRYSNCESLSFDIEQALKCFSQSETGKNFDKNIYFALQYYLYTNPLYKYIPKDSDSINILIIGFGNFSQKYLDIILQTCQMPDKNLNVTVISDSVKKGKEAYLRERPKLIEFFNIDGSLAENSDSYGNINFIMNKFSENTAENENFLKGIEKQYSSVFIAMGNDRFNAETALTARRVFGKNCLVSAVAEQETTENPSFVPVYVRRDFSKDPVSQDIERMAFNTHLIWEQNLNVDIDEVKKEYRKQYNHDSNISFVLSMKYRLFSLGFDMDKMSVQEISRGYVKYLNDNKDAKNQLMYFEHRRWNTEKAVSGYNTLKNLSECIGLGGNKDKNKKLLTCLVKSRPEEKLSSWSKEQWDTKTKKELEAELDELDTMSVRLHQTFLRESKKNFDLHGRTSEIFKSISKEPLCYSAFSELVSNMETVYNRQSSNQWRRYRSLKSAFIDAVNNSNLTQNQQEQIKKQTELLDSQFFPFIESCKYTDYKAFDIALVSGIPFILNYSTKDFYLVIPYIFGKDKLFENLASATVINPTHIIYPLWIIKKEQIQEIQEVLPFIGAYLKNKNLRTRIEFFMGIADSCNADTDNLEEIFRQQNSRISKVKTNIFANEKLFVEFLKKYLTEKSKNKLNFIIQENETRLSGMINSELPSFSFDSVKMHFENIYNCDIVNYIDKRSYLTTDDMTALRLSRGIPKNNPEFFEDYPELWDKYFNNTKEWKSLCGSLSDYSEKNDVLAVFGDKKTPVTLNTYVWYVPLACRDCISEILGMIFKENYIKSYKVTSISANLCKVEITDRFGYKEEFDNIFKNINGLMLGQVRAILYTKSHVVRVVYNNLYVKNFNYSKLNNAAVQLLKYFADKKYLIDFTTDGKKASFIYASYPIKELLTSEGRILEIYTYHKARETGFFDDIKSSLEIMWSGETAKNELDLVATKGFCSLFIECKATLKLENEFYSKLNNIAAHFGVNSKMVLIGDTQEIPNSVTASDNEACRSYGKDLGIITISDRKKIENIGEVLVRVMKGEYK